MIHPYVYAGLKDYSGIKPLTATRVINTAAEAYGVTSQEIKGRSRKTMAKLARHVTAWVLFVKENKTHREVAEILGYESRDMSRVAVRNVYDALDVQDALVVPFISKILKILY